MSPRWLTAIPCCVALLLSGCAGEGPEIVPVTGKVTYRGQPVPQLFLSFQPDNGRQSWGTSDDEGNFELLSSIGLVLVVVTVALVMAGFRLVGRDFMLRRTAT